jgi:hypothetical protein
VGVGDFAVHNPEVASFSKVVSEPGIGADFSVKVIVLRKELQGNLCIKRNKRAYFKNVQKFPLFPIRKVNQVKIHSST